jgi:hypothetical protein
MVLIMIMIMIMVSDILPFGNSTFGLTTWVNAKTWHSNNYLTN